MVRKHPAPQGALRHVAELVEAHEYLESESTHHQKAYSLGIAVRRLPTAPENVQSNRRSLGQALRANPNHPATTGAVLLDGNKGLQSRYIRARRARRNCDVSGHG